MANPRRGEVAAVLDGRERTLCLTLGALAELEGRFGAQDLVALASRFETGRLCARDLIGIIGCGLRGGGEAIGDEEVGMLRTEGGAAGFARIASELIIATFGGAEADEPANPLSPQRPAVRSPGTI